MNVPVWLWLATVGVLLAVVVLDLLLVDNGPHVVSTREAATWVTVYVVAALGFGALVWLGFGARYGHEFYAGWLTEYSLSIDNLFVFVVIIGSFAVPKAYQHKVLFVGIVGALVLRGLFIAIGSAALHRFAGTFFVFGALLVATAVRVARDGGPEATGTENKAIRALRRVVPTTDTYHEGRVLTRVDGRLRATPLLLVMAAIGVTDLLFALDSIPAIFGLTREPYLVFTANVFALMGLRQLYFLVHGLLQRLVYLHVGLALVLAFIGAKMVLSGLHEALGWDVPEVPTLVALGVIVGVLAVTTVASLLRSRRDRRATAPARPGG